MNMLMIILKESLEEDVRNLLRQHNVTAFTEINEATGQGEAGATLHSLSWPGFNNVIFAAMPDPDAKRVIAAIAEYRDKLENRQHGKKIPLRAFSIPCELVV
ncbi:MAG TPA: hypothetical protein VHB46_16160 [Burkholderiales bacterium]|nr:hypothetical protein [Burkholderiales bacterium]